MARHHGEGLPQHAEWIGTTFQGRSVRREGAHRAFRLLRTVHARSCPRDDGRGVAAERDRVA